MLDEKRRACMAHILINGFSAKAGGGKVIFEDYLSCLVEASRHDPNDYFVITPDEEIYRPWNNQRVRILSIPRIYRESYFLPFFYVYLLNRIVKANRIDAVFNFGDIVLPVNAPQVYFFDWSYAVYPDSVAWTRMNRVSYLQRRLKYHIIRFALKYATLTIAQTPTMAERLKTLYGLERVVTVPTPVTLASTHQNAPRDFGLPTSRILLLCLANYAPHKNLEILTPLARLLRERDLDFTIVTTLDPDRSKAARKLLAAIEQEHLADYLINVGYVDPAYVPALFDQCHALLLPTLLESYGLPFVEAMFYERTIITSDFDFTRDVCREAAFYFDPLDVKSIADAISQAFADEARRQKKIALGKKLVSEINDWQGAFRQYQDCLQQVLQS